MRVATSQVTINQINALKLFVPDSSVEERIAIINGISQFVYLNDCIVAFLNLENTNPKVIVPTVEKKEEVKLVETSKNTKDKKEPKASKIVKDVKEEKKEIEKVEVITEREAKIILKQWTILKNYESVREELEECAVASLIEEGNAGRWLNVSMLENVRFDHPSLSNKVIML